MDKPRLTLGSLCEKCLCAACPLREEEACGFMEGDTNWYCHNECKGVEGQQTGCSMHDFVLTQERIATREKDGEKP